MFCLSEKASTMGFLAVVPAAFIALNTGLSLSFIRM